MRFQEHRIGFHYRPTWYGYGSGADEVAIDAERQRRQSARPVLAARNGPSLRWPQMPSCGNLRIDGVSVEATGLI